MRGSGGAPASARVPPESANRPGMNSSGRPPQESADHPRQQDCARLPGRFRRQVLACLRHGHACAAGGSVDVGGRCEQGVADRAGRNRDGGGDPPARPSSPGPATSSRTSRPSSAATPRPVLLRHAPAEHPCSAQSRESRRGTAQIILSGAALTASRQHRNRRADRRLCAQLAGPPVRWCGCQGAMG